MYVDVASESSVLRRCSLPSDGPHDRIVLRPCNQLLAQPAFCVFNIWIANPERQVEGALVVFCEDIEVALGSSVVALPNLVRNGIEAKTNLVSSNQGAI